MYKFKHVNAEIDLHDIKKVNLVFSNGEVSALRLTRQDLTQSIIVMDSVSLYKEEFELLMTALNDHKKKEQKYSAESLSEKYMDHNMTGELYSELKKDLRNLLSIASQSEPVSIDTLNSLSLIISLQLSAYEMCKQMVEDA